MFNTTDIHNINRVNAGPADSEGWLRFDAFRDGAEDPVITIEVQLPFESKQRKIELVDDLSNDRMPAARHLSIVEFFEGCEIKRTQHGSKELGNDWATLSFEQAGCGWLTLYLDHGAQVVWFLGR